ncbi:MAG: hypothetical protein ACTHN5_19425 [Phycisphaerae bacterium]
MTVLEQIKLRVEELDPAQQSALLKFLETFDAQHPAKTRIAKKRRPARSEADAAIRGIAGMWKDRTDLPKDPVQAVKVLRTRMRSRGNRG